MNSKQQSIIEKKQCANCDCVFLQQKMHHVQYRDMFYDTCNCCVQTCSLCGDDVGYLRNENLISNKTCDLCGKEPCKSCGVTIYCDSCEYCCCEACMK